MWFHSRIDFFNTLGLMTSLSFLIPAIQKAKRSHDRNC